MRQKGLGLPIVIILGALLLLIGGAVWYFLSIKPSQTQPTNSTGAAKSATNLDKPAAQSAGAAKLLVTVKDAGSVSYPAWEMNLYRDGSATTRKAAKGDTKEEVKSFPANTVSVKYLIAILQQVGDVSTLPLKSPCVKPATFVSIITVMYNGKTSGDIACLNKQAGRQYEDLDEQLTTIKAHLFEANK